MIDQLKKELITDEGRVTEVYMCSANKPTFGVGHMITKSDPEYGLEIGTAINPDRVDRVFEKDINNTLTDCRRLYANFDDIPTEAQLILANMMFNLGLPRLSKFKRLAVAVENQSWQDAADEMHDSNWRKQLPNRSERLITRMRSLA